MDGQSPFFKPGGTMEPSAPSYVSRAADAQLLQSLMAGEYVYLLDSRQKGKSSLVARTIVKLKEQNISTVKLDLQRIGANVTPDQWYAGLLAGIGQELGITKELFSYWESNQSVGPMARWIGALAEVVLIKVAGNCVIFVDEVDFVRALSFSTDEFFAGIRDCYNRRSEMTGFERLTFCLVGVATPGQLIRNSDVTPFNIGTKIELTDFSLDESKHFISALSVGGRDGESLLQRVHHWVNGHPYLTQLLCAQIAANPTMDSSAAIDRLVKDLFLAPDARHREPNFADVERRLLDPDVPGMTPDERKTQVLELYGRLLRGKGIEATEENPVVASLQLSGVGQHIGGNLIVRNLVYKSVFNEKWRKQSLPNSELRRIQGATRLATLRTSAVAGVILIATLLGAFSVYRLARDRDKALATLTKQSGDLKQQAYVGTMADIRLAINDNRWMRVADLTNRLNDNDLRGWEWAHAALFVNRSVADLPIEPTDMVFEHQADGGLSVVTDTSIFDVTPTKLILRRSLNGPHIIPLMRRGSFRIGKRRGSNDYVLRDAESDRQLLEFKRLRFQKVFDIDAKSMAILSTMPGGNEDPFNLIYLDGKTPPRKFLGPTFAIAGRVLGDGSILTVHQSGIYCRRDMSGKLLSKIKSVDVGMNGYGEIVISPDQSKFTFLDKRYRRLEIRNCRDLSLVFTTTGPLLHAVIASFSADGAKFAVGTSEGVINVFDTRTGRTTNVFPGHRLGIEELEFFGNNQFLASIDNGGKLKTWNVNAPAAIEAYPDQQKQVSNAQLANKGKNLISICQNRYELHSVVSRNMTTGRISKRINIKNLVPTDSHIFGCSKQGDVVRLNIDSLAIEKSVAVFGKETGAIRDFASGSKLLVEKLSSNVNPSNEFAILEAESMKTIVKIQLNWRDALSITDAVSMDFSGKTIAFATSKDLYIVSSEDGRIMKSQQFETQICSAQLSPDGKHVVVALFEPGKFDVIPTVYETSNLTVVGFLPKTQIIDHLAFSPSGKYLAGVMKSGRGNLWNFGARSKLASLSSGAQMHTLSFSPDERRIVTGSTNRTTTIWDAKSGDELYTLRYETTKKDDQFGDLASDSSTFSPDGQKVIVGGTDGWIRVYNSLPIKN